jgi:hypothetical protein
MSFAILVLFSAFLIEGIGTYVSVVGLSSIFQADIVIIILAVALDIGKVVSVSFLYKYFRKVNLLMKTYMTIAVIVLMGITSAGAFGYLSNSFQKAIAGTNESGVMITALSEEQGRLQKRKVEIDAQIAKLPDNMVRGRTTLIKQFGPEVQRINSRLVEIDKELPKLKVETLRKKVEVGPIIYIAQAFNTTPEEAVKWVIFIIIFVFDPLAISLLLAGNFLIEKRQEEKEEAGIKKFFDDGKTIAQWADESYKNSVNALAKVNQSNTPPASPSPINVPLEEEGPSILDYLPEEAEAELSKSFKPAADEYTPTEEHKINWDLQLDFPPIKDEEQVVQIHEPEPEIIQPKEEREVIRLKEVIKSPIHRSSLEDIRSIEDIRDDASNIERLKPLHKVYSETNPIKVGGPSDRAS